MASSNCINAERSEINKFLRTLFQIGLELRTVDVKGIKSLISDRVPAQDLITVADGQDLISCLKRFGLLSENNLDLFIDVLKEIKREDMAIKLKQYQKEVKQVKNLPEQQLVDKLPAPNTKFVRLYFCYSADTFTEEKKTAIQSAFCQFLQIKPADVFFVTSWNAENGCSETLFQLHITDEKATHLQYYAIQRADWLINLGIQQLALGQNARIVLGDCTSDQNGRAPVLPRVKSVLGVNSWNRTYHSNYQLDIILAIELPFSIDVHCCKTVTEQCVQGIKYCNRDTDKRLALVTYGRHANPALMGQNVSFICQHFSENLDVMNALQGRCGTSKEACGTSGIADALHNACSLVKGIRREATKVCILICFVGPEAANLEYYKCYHGYDAINLCHTLAEHAISLYVIGIVLPGVHPTVENHFLNGITAITGGRYFEINDENLLSEVIDCIVKETKSVESLMGTVNDMVIEEINNQYGDINTGHLTRHLQQQLQKRSCRVDRILPNGAALTPVSSISERVSWAYDLEDAIEGVRNMTIRQGMIRQDRRFSFTTNTVANSNDDVDMEISSRMVRRQIQRSSYYKPTTEK